MQQALEDELSKVPLQERKDAWDAQYREQMLAQLGQAMERGDGRKPSEADLRAVPRSSHRAGKGPRTPRAWRGCGACWSRRATRRPAASTSTR